MQLSNLPKTVHKSKKRIGRGHGSGRGGHSSTRGTSGQKQRSSVGLFFEGTKVKKSLLKRLPLFRGKDKFKSHGSETLVINLKYLNVFKSQEVVNLDSLKSKGLLEKDLGDIAVKILGEGEIGVPLTIELPCSKGAREKIEKAGGKVVGEKKEKRKKPVEGK